MKTRFTISRLRAHLRRQAEYSPFATKARKNAKAQGIEYKWEDTVQRVHFIGVEVDLCNLKSVYAVADKLVNGTVGSPDATTYDGLKLPHGSPGTQSYSDDVQQDRWALSQNPGSTGAQRAWGWGLSGLRIPRLDVVVLSAGIGGWLGVDWIPAIKQVLLDTVEAVTWPKFKLANTGAVLKPQSSFPDPKTGEAAASSSDQKEPALGEVFCSNVFGHYILAHELMPLLSRPASSGSQVGGKIIWVSSIEALTEHLSLDDMQALKSGTPYEDSKRLIDVLSLTSELPSVGRIAAPYFDSANTVTATKAAAGKQQPAKGASSLVKPKIYVTQPGIFASEIMPLPFFLVVIYKWLFLIVRWIGSPWHTIEPVKAAVAPVWLALTDTDELEDMEAHGMHKAKWGSATNTSGDERVMKTEVPGWGWDGSVGGENDGEKRKGRKRDAVDLTQEAKEDFEILGVKIWTRMEELRRDWEGILGVKS